MKCKRGEDARSGKEKERGEKEREGEREGERRSEKRDALSFSLSLSLSFSAFPPLSLPLPPSPSLSPVYYISSRCAYRARRVPSALIKAVPWSAMRPLQGRGASFSMPFLPMVGLFKCCFLLSVCWVRLAWRPFEGFCVCVCVCVRRRVGGGLTAGEGGRREEGASPQHDRCLPFFLFRGLPHLLSSLFTVESKIIQPLRLIGTFLRLAFVHL